MAVAALVLVSTPISAQTGRENSVIGLWMRGKPAFGVFVPNENQAARGARGPEAGGGGRAGEPGRGEPGRGGQRGPAVPPLYTREGGERLAANPLYDYVFLNLEGNYDAAAVKAIAEGLRSPKATSRKTLIVRIPPFHIDEKAARARIREIFAMGGDGITFPHVQSVDEARRIVQAFQDAKINVWSPSNPKGDKLAMMMIEDPGALAQVKEFAELKGYSILACGIGSMRQALGGNAQAAEDATQKVLAETKRVRLVNMLTANAKDVEQRVKEGFLALLMQGAGADDAIKVGRAAAGR